ncbi:hypothetical protein C3B44_08710 [Corynebacterium yudongzhengii]|uniref:DUF4352 domain-containing protein n=1 Tax=Corynebacterium yudongzhengii TaxID=2080740 RepID=A0A2U1T4J0_9CORY|nr:hypothetical protein [Corynebacterium yudongzhengii]AWB82419.1 hypothetical protein C3B44_08710 [Corynebacterium yudongzhengii]PWC00885.1 hypothetical protein DF222_10355 [Corynebacterium yudongzhengii]
MTVHVRTRRTAALVGALTATSLLVACADGDTVDQVSPGGELSVTTSETPTAAAEDIDPVRPEEITGPVEDPGLGVTWHFQGTRAGNYGGTVVTVAVTNENEEPLDPEAIGEPSLRYALGGDQEEAPLFETELPEGAPPLQVPLDRPLGVGATTNLHFTFEVSRPNLYDAEFEIGNVIWDGNLVI